MFIAGLHEGDFWDALGFLHRRGYYQLPINLIIFLITRVSIQYWAIFTQFSAFLLQIFVVLSPFLFTHSLHPNGKRRVVLALAFAFLIPNAETWLTLTCAHFLLAVPVFLILADPEANLRSRRAGCNLAYLVIACLGGPPACIFGPAFAIKWLLQPRPLFLVQATVVNSLALLQLALMTLYGDPGEGAALTQLPLSRVGEAVLALPAVWLGQSMVLPLFGFEGFEMFAAYARSHLEYVFMLVSVGAGVVAWKVCRREVGSAILLLLYLTFGLAYLVTILAQIEVNYEAFLITPVIGERYMVLLAHVNFALLHALSNRIGSSVRGGLLQLLCLAAIAATGSAYAIGGRKEFPGPPWRTELEAARRGERPCGLVVPGPEPWVMVLNEDRLRRTLAAELAERGYLEATAPSSDERAYSAAILAFKAEVLKRPAPNTEVGLGLIEELCGYDELLRRYRSSG